MADLLRARLHEEDSATGLWALLTVDGRVHANLAHDQLTRTERIAFELQSREHNTGRVVFRGRYGYTHGGKPYIDVPGAPPTERIVAVHDPVGTLSWDAELVQEYLARAAEAQTADTEEAAVAYRELAQWAPETRAQALADLRDALWRGAPISTFHGQVNYTNLRSPRTLTGQSHKPINHNCLLHGLEEVPLEEWPEAAQLFVTRGAWLIDTFGINGLEYLNGLQLGVGGGAVDAPPGSATVHAPRFRMVDGVLRNKRHQTLQAWGPSRSLLEHVRSSEYLGYPADPETLTGVIESRMDRAASNGAASDTYADVLEELLTVLRHATDSEMAMSRGYRTPQDLIRSVQDSDRSRLVNSGLDDQYCCVVAEKHEAGQADRLWAISSRMRYNTWHFRPWSDNAEDVDGVAEVYAPPGTPDITTHADFHHPGHINYSVKHSIRAPEEIHVGSERFVGIIDVRLSRAVDRRYHEQDLADSVFVASLIKLAYERLVAAARESGTGTQIRGFDIDWYRRTYLPQPTEMTALHAGR
ncbi:hypothetical protein RIF23_15010 [Lipingzhangella sp. LS1_29]|uniref:GAF domain-containing protein n=1 Tax=Lipingzhangella rawalii TaxID=2055835 RepID=A0ABU2H8H2_9ACTN|nr:hypothetical protein [Lipingzhangella rawalii]MDS1271603.1 hypothetical protein [Lipingzhangella rawalii]